MTHSAHFYYCLYSTGQVVKETSCHHYCSISVVIRKGNALFNDALNTFYLQLYGIGHMVKDHSDSERGNLLPPHRLYFSISSKGSFICIIAQTG